MARRFTLSKDSQREQVRLAPGHVVIERGRATEVSQPQVLLALKDFPDVIEVKEAENGKGEAE